MGATTRLRHTLLVIAGTIALLTPRAAGAQETAATLTLSILDAESGEPLPGAQVRLTSAAVGGIADAAGSVRVAGIRPGNHIVVVVRIGYRPEQLLIDFQPGAVVDGEIRMRATPVQLSAVEVTGERRSFRLERRGFYERRESNGFGTFLTEQDIQKLRPSGGTIIDLLRLVPGMNVETDPGTGRPVLYSRRGSDSLIGGACRPTFYLDGVRLPQGGADVGGLDIAQTIVPNEIGAIEVYAGAASTPLEFGSAKGCGAVVIWTKAP